MVRLLEEQLHISRETIHHIITEDLGKKNLCSLRAARVNNGAKSRRVASYEDHLAAYRRDSTF